MSLHAEYIRLIAETDKVLAEKRALMLSAPTPAEAAKWRKGLDETLEERFRLMKRRDTAKENGL